jgi:hypothetical protein
MRGALDVALKKQTISWITTALIELPSFRKAFKQSRSSAW